MTVSFRRALWSGWLGLLLLYLAVARPTYADPAAPPPTLLHMPFVQGYRPPAPPDIFGAEIIPGPEAVVAPLAQEAGLSWARYNQLEWARVEPSPGVRNWTALADFEANIATRSAAGLTNLVIIGEAPAWARIEPDYACSPIRPDALDDFAAFAGEVAARYSRPPFYVNHFEIYNEPDVDPTYAIPTAKFGCWGDEEDPYYGGGYFSEMLSAVYPRIKAANPNAKVIIGGLLLVCDPTHQYPDGRDCLPAKFLRGILRHGNGTNFDGVAYHGYPFHALTRHDWDRTFELWAHRGGVVLGKLRFIREEMAAFGVQKPVYLTEGALLCYENASCSVDQTLLRQDQAGYVVRLFSRAIANDLEAVTWYSLNDPGWRHAGVLNFDNSPRPAYHALQFMASRLRHATFTGTLADGSNGLEGYAFRANNRDVKVYWSNSAVTYPVAVPAGATLYDKIGTALPPPGTGTYLVGFEPVYMIMP